MITGHRGLVEASMFTRLDEMRVGDYFYIDVMGHTLGYKVDRITEINPDDTSKLEDRARRGPCDVDDMHPVWREYASSVGFGITFRHSRRDSRGG